MASKMLNQFSIFEPMPTLAGVILLGLSAILFGADIFGLVLAWPLEVNNILFGVCVLIPAYWMASIGFHDLFNPHRLVVMDDGKIIFRSTLKTKERRAIDVSSIVTITVVKPKGEWIGEAMEIRFRGGGTERIGGFALTEDFTAILRSLNPDITVERETETIDDSPAY